MTLTVVDTVVCAVLTAMPVIQGASITAGDGRGRLP